MMKDRTFPKIRVFSMGMSLIFTLGSCGHESQKTENMEVENMTDKNVESISTTGVDTDITNTVVKTSENFVEQKC